MLNALLCRQNLTHYYPDHFKFKYYTYPMFFVSSNLILICFDMILKNKALQRALFAHFKISVILSAQLRSALGIKCP